MICQNEQNKKVSRIWVNSNHVTYYVITQVGIRLGLRRTMVRNYYDRRDVDIPTPDIITNKLPGAGVQTSYVHSSTLCIHPIHVAAMLNKKRGLEGKFARQYVKLDVTSLLLHVHVT